MAEAKQTKRKAFPKRGRKLLQWSEEEIEHLAGLGLYDYEIAAALGWSVDTFDRRKKDSADFAEALTRGRARAKAQVSNWLFENCRKGDTKAQMFYLERRGGWNQIIGMESADGVGEYSRDALVSRIRKLASGAAEDAGSPGAE